MIHHLQGRLIEKNPTYIVIDCNGVGYLVHVSLYTYERIGSDESVRIFTHLIVKEDDHILFGFTEKHERELFKLLLSVSGVGANTARLIQSSLGPNELERAILSEDVEVLKSVKGIGAKSAQRIILDLKDKISKISTLSSGETSSVDSGSKMEAVSALEVLGFQKAVVGKVVGQIVAENPSISVEDIIKEALKKL